jgi:hypothetical protein
MKKALLVAFIVAAISQVKAQQLLNVKPSDSLKNNLFEQYFKVQPQNQLPWALPQLNLSKTSTTFDGNVKISPYDHMPIAFLQGNSKMPVVKSAGSYKMPVLRPGDGNVEVVPAPQKQTP